MAKRAGRLARRKGNILRRYTNIPALIYLLTEKKITLLDPESWNDKNDSHFLSVYRKKKSLETVLALCFTGTKETYHHWRVFANGSSGVCIHFRRDKLIHMLEKTSGVTIKPVRYRKINKGATPKLKTDELPFLKRAPYSDERELRAIFESEKEKLPSLDVCISLGCIDRVTLSPWMPRQFKSHLKAAINRIPGCNKLEVMRSTLVSNQRWKNAADLAR